MTAASHYPCWADKGLICESNGSIDFRRSDQHRISRNESALPRIVVLVVITRVRALQARLPEQPGRQLGSGVVVADDPCWRWNGRCGDSCVAVAAELLEGSELGKRVRPVRSVGGGYVDERHAVLAASDLVVEHAGQLLGLHEPYVLGDRFWTDL
jgi:hypothetical protein